MVLLALAIMVQSLGCATTPTEDYIIPGTTTLRVTSLDIRGVESFPLSEIKQGLATREDPGWRAGPFWSRVPFIGVDRRYYNYFDWQRDVERILVYYFRRGYFNAQILTESVIEDPAQDAVRIRLVIDEGEPVHVRTISFEGVEYLPEALRERLFANQALSEGDIFREDGYLQTRETLVTRLRQNGYAFAQVSGRVFVYPEERAADIYFYTDTGPETVFGTIYVVGLEDVDERFVRQAIPFARGDRYDPRRLIESQMDIYDLRVFGLVTVLPAHEARDLPEDFPVTAAELEDIILEREDPMPPLEEIGEDIASEIYEPEPAEDPPLPLIENGQAERAPTVGPLGVSRFLASAQEEAERRARLPQEVPVIVRVKEAKKYNVRIGAGVNAENTRQDARILLNWSARNFLGGLRRLDHFNAFGYAWAPGVILAPDVVNQGVVLSSELRFSQPQFLERRTNFRSRARVDRDVREGFTVWNPSLRLGLDRTFWRYLIIDATYNLSFFSYTNVDGGLFDIADTALGLDFDTSFLLEFLEQSIAFDLRDDVIDPRRGFLTSLTVQQAGRYLVGGEFDFLKAILSAEGYIPAELFTSVVFAARLRLGSVYNIGREREVPIQSRLYSGGTDGMRGLGRRRLSLYTPTGDPVPVGGLTQFESVLETRLLLSPQLLNVGDLWGAAFFDAATILRGQLLFDTEPNNQGVETWPDIAQSLVYAVGLGLWWVTPVGPIRLDGAYTLSDITNDLRFRRCVNPQDYATEACDFVPIENDPIQTLVSRWTFYLSVGHSF
jgi:outer membrane protein insertion porin family